MASQPRRNERDRSGTGRSVRTVVAFVLLLGECVVILVPSIYGRLTPKLFGIPFFYWFQLLWIIVGMAVTGLAYLLMQNPRSTAIPPEPERRTEGQ